MDDIREFEKLVGGKKQKGTAWKYSRKISNLRLSHSPRRGKAVPWGAIRVLMKNREGPDRADAAYRELGALVTKMGGLDAWTITRVDIAVDYDIWLFDLLPWSPRTKAFEWWEPEWRSANCLRRRPQAAPWVEEPTAYVGDRLNERNGSYRTHYRVYWAECFGSRTTRIEKQIMRPRIPLAELASLPNPFKCFHLVPMWGEIDHQLGVLLRLVQGQGRAVVQKMLYEGWPGDEGRRAWKVLVAYCNAAKRTSGLVQPQEAFRTGWSAEANRIMALIAGGSE